MGTFSSDTSQTPRLVTDGLFFIDSDSIAEPGVPVAVFDSDCSLHLVEIDNSLNTDAVYVKLFEATSIASVTLGHTAPDAQFMCPATSTITYALPMIRDVLSGAIYLVGCVYTVLTMPGTDGTGADTAEGLPAAQPTVKMFFNTH